MSRRPRRLAFALALCLWALSAAGEAQRAQDQPKVIFLLPADEPAADTAQLTEALLAQFALLDVQLALETWTLDTPDLSARLQRARTAGAARGAVAVFWIDKSRDPEWLLHMLDVAGSRLLVRPIRAAAEQRGAALEVVAVMARESTQTLLAPLPQEPTAKPPAEPPVDASSLPPPPPDPKPWRLTLWVGYGACGFAPDLVQHGLSGGALSAFGPGERARVGASTLLSPALRSEAVPASFDLWRLPLAAWLGYRVVDGAVPVDLLAGVGAELLVRTQVRAPLDATTERIRTEADTVDLLGSAGLRVRTEWPTDGSLGVHASLGADILINNVEYVSRELTTGARVELLSPRRLRWSAELALAFRP